MNFRTAFFIAIAFLYSSQLHSQDSEDDLDEYINVSYDPNAQHFNITLEPVIFNQFDEQFMLASGVKLTAYHFVNRASLDAGFDKRWLNFNGSFSYAETSLFLEKPNFSTVLGNNFYVFGSYSVVSGSFNRVRRADSQNMLDLRFGFSRNEISTFYSVRDIQNSPWFDGDLHFLQRMNSLKFGLSFKFIRNSFLNTPGGSRSYKSLRYDYFFDVHYLLNDPFPQTLYLNTNVSYGSQPGNFVALSGEMYNAVKNSASKFPFGFFFGSNFSSMHKHSINVAIVLGLLPGYHNETIDRLFFSGTIGYCFTRSLKKK